MFTYFGMIGVTFMILTLLLIWIVLNSISDTNMIDMDNSDLISAGIVMFILSMLWPLTLMALVCMASLWAVWRLTAFCVRIRICGKH